MSGAEQRGSSISPEMIQLSIGIEQVDDMIGDFDHALDAAN
jgi:O-acetylhomoserine/O-acetylserine sulfhydrylase-like pyridoxal-dependent enzyme